MAQILKKKTSSLAERKNDTIVKIRGSWKVIKPM